MNKRLVRGIVAAVVLGVAWWLISPFFIDKRVSEEFPTQESEIETEVTENSLVVTLFEDVEIKGGAYSLLQPADTRENKKVFDGIEFTLTPSPNPPVIGEVILTFNLRIDGRFATDMQTQFGVYGSSVAIKKDTMEIVPISIVKRVTPHGTLEFRTTFHESGEYLVLTQFKRAENIITTDFSIYVR